MRGNRGDAISPFAWACDRACSRGRVGRAMPEAYDQASAMSIPIRKCVSRQVTALAGGPSVAVLGAGLGKLVAADADVFRPDRLPAGGG